MLYTSKAIQESNISAKIIKENGYFSFTEVICKYLNDSVDEIKFPNWLKLANITPVFKKSSRNSKKTYTNQHSAFERFLSKQPSEFFESILSKFQCGFRKVAVLNTAC